ncbi:MAG TPA: YncE family protein [Solirubrobacterales bacterium]
MRTGPLVVLLTCLAVLFGAATASAADRVFWTDDGNETLGVTALDGSGASTLNPTPVGVEQPYGTAIDSATGRVYWADALSNSIKFANLDGTESGTLDTGSAELDVPEGIAIDPQNDRVYWANWAGDTIGWASLDDSGEAGMIDTGEAPIGEPAGVVVDPAEGRIYWTAYEESLIGWASLDGLGAGELEVFDVDDLEGPAGLAIDASTGRVYWANYDTGTIGWSTLDGNEGGLRSVGPLAEPEGAIGIAIDPEADKLFWANENGFVAELDLGRALVRQLDIGTGSPPVEPSFPVLLKKPKFEPVAVPPSPVAQPSGSTLTCYSVPTEPDLPESFLYRAPQSVAYEWAHEGVTVAGATGQTLVATEPGGYSCETVATNGAGSAEASGGSFTIETPPAVVTPPPVSPPTAPPAEPPAPQPIHVTLPSVTVLKVRSEPGRGTATVLADVSGPGTVAVSGTKVVHDSVKVAGAGVAKLKVVAKAGAAQQLLRGGRSRVRVRLTFVTSEGGIASASRVLALRRVTK